ncbi:uncharacterized protein BDV14DRAFT_195445 [Aspergillus stella-maris]|uniref:uncharacterized protein n=1 Tax=Aspergillus stella-maris TaxID=1810926 RepID=UPI003CCD514F
MAAMSTMMPPKIPVGLADLPPELMDSIASYLPSETIISLRSTNRYNYHTTITQFAARYFTSIHTDLSSDSFMRLHNISKDPRFAPSIKAIRFTRKRPANVGHGIFWPRSGVYRQIDLNCEAVSLLAEIIRRFENCTSFDFHQPQGPIRTFKEDLVIADAAYIMMETLVCLNRPIDEFTVNLQCMSSNDSKFNLRALCRIPERFSFMFFAQGIRKLVLDFEIRCEYLADNIAEMLRWATGLKSLTLIAQHGRFATELIKWTISRAGVFRLQELTLVGPPNIMFWVEPLRRKSLSRFLSIHSRTLERLTLRHLQVEDSTEWGDIVGRLGTKYPHLMQIYLGRLTGRDGDGETDRIHYQVIGWKAFAQLGAIKFYRDHGCSKTKLRTGAGQHATGIFYEGPELGKVMEGIEVLYFSYAGW